MTDRINHRAALVAAYLTAAIAAGSTFLIAGTEGRGRTTLARKLMNEEKGATTTEYALIAAGVGLATVAFLAIVGGKISGWGSTVSGL